MTTQEMLDAALSAKHALVTGTQAVMLRDPTGRQVQYTPASLPALERYIAELRQTLAGGKPTRNRINYMIPD